MFKVRPEQMKVFQPIAEAVFVREVAEFLRKEHAGALISLPNAEKTVAELSDAMLRAVVEGGIAQARQHGLSLKSDLTSFVTTMVLTAPNFGEHPTARQILSELAAKAPIDRQAAGELFQKFMEQMPEENWREVTENYDPQSWKQPIEYLALPPEEPGNENWQDAELLRMAQETQPSSPQMPARTANSTATAQLDKTAKAASSDTKKTRRNPVQKKVLKKQVKQAGNKQPPQPVAPMQTCPNKNWVNLIYTYNSKRAVSFADYVVCDAATEKPLASGKLDIMGKAHVPNLPEGVEKYVAKLSSDPQPFTPFENNQPKPHNLTPDITEIKDEDGVIVSVGKWMGTALAGDFANDQTYGQIAFGTVVTLIPVVDQIGDVRDVSANIYHLAYKKRYAEFSPWFGLVTSLIGCVPALGTLLKGACKALFEAAKKGLDKLPFEQLAVHLNTLGEGNVKNFLVKFLQDIPAYTADITRKLLKILREMEVKLVMARDSLLNKVFDEAQKHLDTLLEGIRKLLSLAPAMVQKVMTRIAGYIKGTLSTIKDFAIEVQARADNGARQLKRKLFSYGRKVDLTQAAKESGMQTADVQRLISHCKDHDRLVVMRFTNPASLKHHGKPKHVSKPLDVKLKTSKKGEHAGLVLAPREPMEKWERENFKELTEFDPKKPDKRLYSVDKDGCLLDPDGNRIYGDHDIQSVHQKVYDEDGKKSYLQDQTNPEDSSTVKDMNDQEFAVVDEKGNFTPLENPRAGAPRSGNMYNHGGNDNYMVKAKLDEKGRYVRNEKGEIEILRDEKGKPIPATVEDMNSGRAVMGRSPGKDEQFLVVNEEGDLLIMDSPEQLEEFHRASGMIWEYDATPAIAPAANAQIILGAERATRENETAKAQ